MLVCNGKLGLDPDVQAKFSLNWMVCVNCFGSEGVCNGMLQVRSYKWTFVIIPVYCDLVFHVALQPVEWNVELPLRSVE